MEIMINSPDELPRNLHLESPRASKIPFSLRRALSHKTRRRVQAEKIRPSNSPATWFDVTDGFLQGW